jgi:hypothetical protein
MLIKSTKVSFTTNVYAEYETATFAKRVIYAVTMLCVIGYLYLKIKTFLLIWLPGACQSM